MSQSYAMGAVVDAPFDEAIQQVTEALKAEGFGVLTEIDVKQTLAQKIGVDFRKYTILGACNPKLAHRALEADPDVGLLLPCNVVVEERDGRTRVGIVDPRAMFQVAAAPALGPIAEEARERLQRALDAITR